MNEEQRAIRDFLWRVEDGLNSSQATYHRSMAYGKPHNMTQEAWDAGMEQTSRSLIGQWEMLRKLKKQYGVK